MRHVQSIPGLISLRNALTRVVVVHVNFIDTILRAVVGRNVERNGQTVLAGLLNELLLLAGDHHLELVELALAGDRQFETLVSLRLGRSMRHIVRSALVAHAAH